MTTFRLPDLGEGLQEAEIVSWHVNAGEHIVADQPLVSVETAKAVVEVPSPYSGLVQSLYGKPGDVVRVGAPLAEIEPAGDTTDQGTVVGSLPASAVAERPAARSAPPSHAKASPAVRKLAGELGVEIDGLKGSGPGGALTRADVEAAARIASDGDGYQPLRGVRRAMAEAMVRSGLDVVPSSVTDVALIERWSDSADPTIRLIRAIVAGCRTAPELNAWYDSVRKARRLHETIDLGIAIETGDGLFAPVLRNVAARNEQGLREDLQAMKRDVAARTVPLGELRGQTITLSNFGMLGGMHAALAIVPPQVAILGAGRIHRAPHIVDGEVRAARIMPLSLTFDHRAVTGAEAIRFLVAAIVDLERPE